MSDQDTSTTSTDTDTSTTEPADQDAAAADSATDSADDSGRAGGDRALLNELGKARREKKALEQRLQEIEQSQLSDLEKAQRAAQEATARAEAAEQTALRQRVALSAGIPAEHIHRLQGSTEDELAADAKELAKFLVPKSPRPDPSQGSRADNARPLDMNTLIRQAAGR